jgi:sulfur carrier protein
MTHSQRLQPAPYAGGVEIIANGRSYRVDLDTTVAEFIRSRGLDPRFVVVERNGEPVARERYESVALSEGDRLELVRAVAGG